MARIARSAPLEAAGATAARGREGRRSPAAVRGVLLAALLFLPLPSAASAAQDAIPELTDTVNDFANVVDAGSRGELDTIIRTLQQTTGDAVVVATVRTFKPYADIREYAVKMFENHGRGIGQRGRDNGLLVVVAVDDRQVWVEVGYDLEQFITDGYAGETSRQYMIPEFRSGAYGRGLVAGVQRIIGRIAEGRNVKLDGVRTPVAPPTGGGSSGSGGAGLLALFVLFLLLSAVGRLRGNRFGRRRRWHSGVGPFGGGFGGFGGLGGGFGGGGFGGGGFGGGFGGFGGGHSGGGGGGGSW